MIGRDRELEASGRFLETLKQGSACLLFEGEPGIGKTTVWRETVALAEQRSHRVLACRPAAAEAKLSFAGLADILSGVEEEVLARLPPPQRQALDVALLRAPVRHQAPEPRALFAALSSTLAALAEQGPVLLAVDDLQWLDRPTQAALEFAVRRLGERPIGLLAAVRVGENEKPLPPGLARAIEEARTERIVLGPLSIAALHVLISERLGRAFARPILVRIASATCGNPFYGLEVARELIRRGEPAAGEGLPVPDDLSELVAARIRRLPRATKAALLTAAALSTPMLELLDLPALAGAERAGFVQIAGDRLSFSHPLFATAVYASASAEQRSEVHRRLARLVQDKEERARHLALGAAGPSERIARALDAAADQARSRGAPDAAAELMELAVRLTPRSRAEQSRARVLAAAQHHFHAGHLSRARTLAEQVLERSATGPVRGQALRVLGEIRYSQDSFGEAVPLFEQALAELGDDFGAVDLYVDLAYARTNLGEVAAAVANAKEAVERARSAGDNGLYAVALAAAVIADNYGGQPLDRGRLELALELEDLDRRTVMPMRPSLIAGIMLGSVDDLDRAATVLARLRLRTIDHGEESDLPTLSPHLSMIERRRGKLAAALAVATEGYEIARMLGSATAQVLTLGERCYVRAVLGDVPGAREDAEEAQRLASRGEPSFPQLWLRGALAFLELSLGDASAASEALEPVAVAIESRGQTDPITAAFIPDMIEALVALGELDRAEALARLLEQYGRRQPQPSMLAVAARCLALIRAARGDLSGAAQAAGEALRRERADIPFALGRTLLIKGQIERRAKQKRAARESLGRATEIFEHLGATIWAERARGEQARTGIRHTESGSLTPTELRVAELAADGLTNKRIGETLFLSGKTVEVNLARVYRKLGIRSRAQLGRAIAEQRQRSAEQRRE